MSELESPRRVRLDSPSVLAPVGAIAIHVILAVVGDALIVALPPKPYVPPPHVELVDIEPLPQLKPPPPPPKAPEVPLPPAPQVVHHIAKAAPVPVPTEPPPPTTTPPTTTPSSTDEGGAPVTTMDDIAPSATGVAVAKGPRNTGHVGRGGAGTGTGSGTGSGSENPAATPTSIATIKTRAMPRGDFSYVDASKDYPAEAKTLGIEGVIRVRLIVDETGKVKSVLLLNKLGHGLDELALERAKKIDFDPAKDTDDKPVTSVVVWTFNMTLPK